jgi:hypothetical protein
MKNQHFQWVNPLFIWQERHVINQRRDSRHFHQHKSSCLQTETKILSTCFFSGGTRRTITEWRTSCCRIQRNCWSMGSGGPAASRIQRRIQCGGC